MRINEGEIFRKRPTRKTAEEGVSMEAVKDKGELLIESVKEGMNKFGELFNQGEKQQFERMISNITEFKKSSGKKYQELLKKTFKFLGTGDEIINNLRIVAIKEIAPQINKLLILNELIAVENINPPKRLREIADKHFKEGKIPLSDSIKTLLKTEMSEEDYKFIEHGLKIGDWLDIGNKILKEDRVYEIIVNDKKFCEIENSIKKLKKIYGQEIEIAFEEEDLDILSNKEKIEKILPIKKGVESLADYYKIDEIKKLEDLKDLAEISEDFRFDIFLTGGFKDELNEIKEMYGLKEFNSVRRLINWFRIGKENPEFIFSGGFAKILSEVSNKIGRNEAEILYHFEERNFSPIQSRTFLELAIGNIVFSEDVKATKLPLSELFTEMPSVLIERRTLYGRERRGSVRNVADYTALGRGDRRDPYKRWAYIAAARGLKRENLESEISDRFLNGEVKGEPGIEQAKKKFDYVKEHLPAVLKPRFEKILKTLEEWGNEGKKIEEKVNAPLTAGAYVRFDSKLEVEKSLVKKLAIPVEKYKELYSSLDKSFKTASTITSRLGAGIEQLYFLIQKKSRDLSYLKSRPGELSKAEKEIIEDEYKYLLEPIELMESVYNTQRSVYLDTPPLHGFGRGEDLPEWDPDSHPLRDRVFYKFEQGGKENYINVKEYHLGQGEDDLKVRLYSFSEKPDQKELGKGGMVVEIERNGKTKFLNEMETKIFMKEIKKRTLATLYLEDSMLLQIESGK